MTKSAYYLHYSGASDNNVFQVVIIDLKAVYVCQAKQERCISMDNVEMYFAYKAVDLDSSDRGGYADAELYTDLSLG